MARNIDMIINTIYNWEGSFDELAKEFSVEEYKILFENGNLEYTCDEWMEEECYMKEDYSEMLYWFIADFLMVDIAQGNRGSVTNNLFRLWNRG